MGAAAGVLRMFRGAHRTSVTPDGKMPLADHLRELRARLLRVSVALVVAMVVALFFYDVLLDLVRDPYEAAVAGLDDVESQITSAGVGGPLLLQLKLSAVAALVAVSPYWLYQVWAFIVPGLHAQEKRWTRIFTAFAGPLFLLGIAVGYYVLPRGLEVLIGFTPAGVTNLVEFGDYFSFFVRLLLVFGIAFEVPLFIVMLNLAGVVSGRSLAEHRAWIIIGTFVFAAVATPSTDPFTMLFLAGPMLGLILISELIARFVDSRRAARASEWDDDEASPLDLRPSSLDDGSD